MGEKVPLTHPDFDGMLNSMISKRAVLHELASNRHVLETNLGCFMKKVKWVVMVVMVIALLIASTLAVSQWWMGDRMYDAGLKDAYKAKNQKQVDRDLSKLKEITVREVK